MKKRNHIFAWALAGAMILSLSACGGQSGVASASVSSATAAADLTFDNSKWNYDTTNHVYWQIGVTYCATPQDSDYETMGIYVPSAYLTGSKNSDGTYTCSVNKKGAVSDYTAATAPVVIPVNTPGYAAAAAPTEYSYDSVSSYLKAGFVYLQPGIRGRITSMGTTGGGQQTGGSTSASVTQTSATTSSSASDSTEPSGGAPWGVTDLKAAIRYFRLNADVLPGSSDQIYTFGMSGGGAQSALVGATGDSKLYTPYLEAIGAAMTDANGKAISDAVTGSMCWCPITSLDYADEAYEWNMGQFSSSGVRASSSFGSVLSQDLATAYASYLNKLGLKNGDTTLTLKQSDSGIYQAGTYYNYLLSEIETSLNHFLSDTTFPYTPTTQSNGGGHGTMGASSAAGKPDGAGSARPNDSAAFSGSLTLAGSGQTTGTGAASEAGAASGSDSTTYQTAQDYIDALNADTTWISYNASKNTAQVTSISAFVKHCKNAAKDLGAFDELDRGQSENNVFGNGRDSSLHFDATLAKLLKDNADAYAKFSDWDASYGKDYQSDLTQTDTLGTSMATRVNMYNPMYYLNQYYDGYQTSAVAKYWRIRTGIDQTDTALTVETNLALALRSDSRVKSVDFATVWGQGHTEAERTGDNTTNFISWVQDCAAK